MVPTAFNSIEIVKVSMSKAVDDKKMFEELLVQVEKISTLFNDPQKLWGDQIDIHVTPLREFYMAIDDTAVASGGVLGGKLDAIDISSNVNKLKLDLLAFKSICRTDDDVEKEIKATEILEVICNIKKKTNNVLEEYYKDLDTSPPQPPLYFEFGF